MHRFPALICLLGIPSLVLVSACGDETPVDTADLYQQGFDAGYASGKAEVAGLEVTVSDLQAAVATLQAQMTDAQADISELQDQEWATSQDLEDLGGEVQVRVDDVVVAVERLATLGEDHEERISTAELTLASQADQVGALDARVTTAEGTLDAQASTLAVHESAIAGQTTTLATHQALLDDLDRRADALEAAGTVDLTELEGRLTTVKDAITAIQDDYLPAAALAGYATEAWVMAQDAILDGRVNEIDGRVTTIEGGYLAADDLAGYATEAWVGAWVETQGYASESELAALDGRLDVIEDDLPILDGRLAVIEDDYLPSTALTGYATEAWVLARGYGLASDLLALDGRVTTAESRLAVIDAAYVGDAELTAVLADVDDLDGRLATVEGDYLVSADVDDAVRLIDTDTTWTITTSTELLDALERLDGYAISSDATLTLSLAAGSYSFTSPVYFRYSDGDRVVIQGADESTTILYFPASDGLRVEDGSSLGYLTDLTIMGADASDYDGILVTHGSYLDLGTVTVRNFGGSCVYADLASSITANDGLTATVCGLYGVAADNSSAISAESADVSYADQAGFMAAHASAVAARYATSSNNGYYGYYGTMAGSIDAYYSTATGNESGYMAYKNGVIGARYTTASSNKYAFRSEYESFIDASSGTVSSSSSYDFKTYMNSSIHASSSTGTSVTTSANDTTDWVNGK